MAAYPESWLCSREMSTGYARAVEWGEGVAASSARRVRTERGEPTDPVVKRASCDQRGAARLPADFASLSHK